MKNELIKLADRLDRKGLNEEASYLDSLIKKYSEDSTGSLPSPGFDPDNQDGPFPGQPHPDPGSKGPGPWGEHGGGPYLPGYPGDPIDVEGAISGLYSAVNTLTSNLEWLRERLKKLHPESF